LVKQGNEELENWLLRLLNPKINFYFYTINIDDKSVVILDISKTSRQPCAYSSRFICKRHWAYG